MGRGVATEEQRHSLVSCGPWRVGGPAERSPDSEKGMRMELSRENQQQDQPVGPRGLLMGPGLGRVFGGWGSPEKYTCVCFKRPKWPPTRLSARPPSFLFSQRADLTLSPFFPTQRSAETSFHRDPAGCVALSWEPRARCRTVSRVQGGNSCLSSAELARGVQGLLCLGGSSYRMRLGPVHSGLAPQTWLSLHLGTHSLSSCDRPLWFQNPPPPCSISPPHLSLGSWPLPPPAP